MRNAIKDIVKHKTALIAHQINEIVKAHGLTYQEYDELIIGLIKVSGAIAQCTPASLLKQDDDSVITEDPKTWPNYKRKKNDE